MKRVTALALALVAAAALGGCRDEEQGRVLALDRGQYGGPAIPQPPAEAAKGWREHAEKMKY